MRGKDAYVPGRRLLGRGGIAQDVEEALEPAWRRGVGRDESVEGGIAVDDGRGQVLENARRSRIVGDEVDKGVKLRGEAAGRFPRCCIDIIDQSHSHTACATHSGRVNVQ